MHRLLLAAALCAVLQAHALSFPRPRADVHAEYHLPHKMRESQVHRYHTHGGHDHVVRSLEQDTHHEERGDKDSTAREIEHQRVHSNHHAANDHNKHGKATDHGAHSNKNHDKEGSNKHAAHEAKVHRRVAQHRVRIPVVGALERDLGADHVGGEDTAGLLARAARAEEEGRGSMTAKIHHNHRHHATAQGGEVETLLEVDESANAPMADEVRTAKRQPLHRPVRMADDATSQPTAAVPPATWQEQALDSLRLGTALAATSVSSEEISTRKAELGAMKADIKRLMQSINAEPGISTQHKHVAAQSQLSRHDGRLNHAPAHHADNDLGAALPRVIPGTQGSNGYAEIAPQPEGPSVLGQPTPLVPAQAGKPVAPHAPEPNLIVPALSLAATPPASGAAQAKAVEPSATSSASVEERDTAPPSPSPSMQPVPIVPDPNAEQAQDAAAISDSPVVQALGATARAVDAQVLVQRASDADVDPVFGGEEEEEVGEGKGRESKNVGEQLLLQEDAPPGQADPEEPAWVLGGETDKSQLNRPYQYRGWRLLQREMEAEVGKGHVTTIDLAHQVAPEEEAAESDTGSTEPTDAPTHRPVGTSHNRLPSFGASFIPLPPSPDEVPSVAHHAAKAPAHLAVAPTVLVDKASAPSVVAASPSLGDNMPQPPHASEKAPVVLQPAPPAVAAAAVQPPPLSPVGAPWMTPQAFATPQGMWPQWQGPSMTLF